MLREKLPLLELVLLAMWQPWTHKSGVQIVWGWGRCAWLPGWEQGRGSAFGRCLLQHLPSLTGHTAWRRHLLVVLGGEEWSKWGDYSTLSLAWMLLCAADSWANPKPVTSPGVPSPVGRNVTWHLTGPLWDPGLWQEGEGESGITPERSPEHTAVLAETLASLLK